MRQLLIAILLSLAGCRGTGSDAVLLDESDGGADACASLCTDVSADPAFFACYNCRCKAAMDGWLPRAEDIRCSAGEEVVVYKGTKTEKGLALAKVTSEETSCFNPPRLSDAQAFNGGCNPGSKLGQLQHGSVYVKWICRREHFQADVTNPTIPYDDTGFIVHNARTGATCFYDDHDGLTTDGNNPDPNIDGDAAKAAAFAKTYIHQDGSGCVGCHDNDPFLFTPYLRSVGWPTDGEWMTSAYWRVTASPDKAGAKATVGKMLTSEGAAGCTSCHRIGQSGTCSLLSMDSMGEGKAKALQAFMTSHDPKDYGKALSPQGKEHLWPYWMPSTAFPLTLAAWDKKFGAAKKTLTACCADANAAGCSWEDIPAEPQNVLRLQGP
jgi:hypothetical protein